MTAPDNFGDILFWLFPIFIPVVLIVNFWIIGREIAVIDCLRKGYGHLYEKFGSPNARVAWIGIAALNSRKRQEMRHAARLDIATMRSIDEYESAIHFRRGLWVVLIVFWIAFMATGDISL